MHPDAQTPYQTKEVDPRWTAVDNYAASHLHPSHSASLQKALDHAQHLATEAKLPDIAVSPLQGSYLAVQARLLRATHVLEVGTLGGYSTLWLASARPDLKITTIEYDEKHLNVAKAVFEAAGPDVSNRIELIHGSAHDVLPRLAEDIRQGRREKWDFVFIDADKPSNPAYLDICVPMTRKDGCVIVDNVVRKGTLAREELAKDDPKVRGSREVVEQAGRDDRIVCTLMQTVGSKNYDGFLMCAVK